MEGNVEAQLPDVSDDTSVPVPSGAKLSFPRLVALVLVCVTIILLIAVVLSDSSVINPVAVTSEVGTQATLVSHPDRGLEAHRCVGHPLNSAGENSRFIALGIPSCSQDALSFINSSNALGGDAVLHTRLVLAGNRDARYSYLLPLAAKMWLGCPGMQPSIFLHGSREEWQQSHMYFVPLQETLRAGAEIIHFAYNISMYPAAMNSITSTTTIRAFAAAMPWPWDSHITIMDIDLFPVNDLGCTRWTKPILDREIGQGRRLFVPLVYDQEEAFESINKPVWGRVMLSGVTANVATWREVMRIHEGDVEEQLIERYHQASEKDRNCNYGRCWDEVLFTRAMQDWDMPEGWAGNYRDVNIWPKTWIAAHDTHLSDWLLLPGLVPGQTNTVFNALIQFMTGKDSRERKAGFELLCSRAQMVHWKLGVFGTVLLDKFLQCPQFPKTEAEQQLVYKRKTFPNDDYRCPSLSINDIPVNASHVCS